MTSTENTTRTTIDPRGPRFGAAITAVLLLVAIALALLEGTADSLTARLVQPAFILFLAISLVFAWGAFAGVARHPYGLLFKKAVRPRLDPPAELEDPAPPTFAQGVGFVITAIGVVLFLVGVPYAIVITGSLAFIAAFLNSVFDYCIGCQLYLLLVRAGIIRRNGSTAATA
jgi:small-conductance mechanosensitive channel